ncbi:N-acetylmuramoyl-L-alanine amidase [Thermomicrobium roseum]|uniref:N-acetylmuramoyl-L-alanine amidase domain protein n=1 Tax=Thermomicrobium roseum (strain ATCC 27502 / DSM 5159 / P-2) TaxID=309801 RepID=B9L1S2_THERP|nr:N-acetylmuramoyl-L-alanine amidase [Thermomicrobium roseum]ACM06109.1 N-acetylmuramoyl-L-alanine amidase domain protein [Thermomicrobium roseum DSM 5159]
MRGSRLTRRMLLRVAGGVIAATVMELGSSQARGGVIRRTSWFVEGPFPTAGQILTPVYPLPFSFRSVEVSWQASVPRGALLQLSVRLRSDGESWSDWIPLAADPHTPPAQDDGWTYAPPILASGRAVQLGIVCEPGIGGAGPRVEAIRVTAVEVSLSDMQWFASSDLIDGWIVPRAGWGADESLRFDENGKEIWPPRYAPIQKVIVHHTVTRNDPPDPAATIRAIYAYHAVTLGWGDIGYNFVVDWQGRVYEGRYGGPNVVGAHTAGYNTGTLGIAVLGDFTATDPPRVVLDALARLVRTRAGQLDPGGIGPFRDLVDVPNIGGHRDYNITECPGDRLYAQLPLLRGMLKGTGPIVFPSKPRRLEPRAQLVSVTFTPASELYAGTLVRVDAVVRNVGPIELPTQGPPPGFIYDEGQTFDSVGFPKEEGAFRVGVDFEGNTGVPNPFRWGLPAPLPPGQEATVTGFIRLRSVRSWRLTASLVREYVRYEQQGVFPKDLTTLPPPTAPVPPSSDPNMIYFEVTQHNVPRVFYDYWRANGGLERFGYPLTEPFVEVSATDGQQYLVQYFERARFEHHPELAGTPFEVLLGLLGVERTRGRENEPAFRPVERPADPQIDYFVETRHTLRPPFQAYWWSRGGPAVFGYPISEPFEEVSKTDGQRYLVQYFERNRMEYHPELAGTRFEILLGHLGREALIDRGWLPGA